MFNTDLLVSFLQLQILNSVLKNYWRGTGALPGREQSAGGSGAWEPGRERRAGELRG